MFIVYAMHTLPIRLINGAIEGGTQTTMQILIHAPFIFTLIVGEW